MALMEAKINGVWRSIPTPKPDGYFPYYAHLENSYNDALGNLHRDFIWKNRAKIECSYNTLSGDDFSFLQSLYELEEFSMRFIDNKGRKVEKIMYSTLPKGAVYKKDKFTDMPKIWRNCSVNFVEKRR